MYNYNADISLNDLLPILDGISDAVFIDDGSGICRWCNSACEDMYMISLDEIRGKSVDQLEKEGVFSPSVTKRVLDEKREITIIHENRIGKRLLTTGTPVFAHDTKEKIAEFAAAESPVDSGGDTEIKCSSEDYPYTDNASTETSEALNSITENPELSMVITISKDITQITTSAKRPENARISLLNSYRSDELEAMNFTDKSIVARSESMLNIMALTKKLATISTTVLITGESGVGKGLIAKALHEEGPRSKGPFVTVNCGAIPESLIESELFGYVAGAFTGSRADGKKGYFEAAQGGTIFLDEIAELPLPLQVKLLQVIQERAITPIGSVTSIPVDVRIVSATNKNLEELVKSGEFREDLYYRLNVVPVNVPPLRERTADIAPLLKYYLAKANDELNTSKSLNSDALSILVKYPWPGNIRELQNIVERLIITSSSDVITKEDIFVFIKDEAEKNTEASASFSLTQALENAEKEILTRALNEYKSTRAIARVLQVSQPTIVRKLNKYGLKLKA